MTSPPAHKWAFAPRFRRHAFGWRSQPAVQRVREATAEIQKAAKKDPALAGAGAVLFLEKVSPALEQVDSSSGAIGTAVNHAIEACASIVAEAQVDDRTRDQWLDRLWEAHQNDEIPYIERLGDYWGELCASRERASAWADRLDQYGRDGLEPEPKARRLLPRHDRVPERAASTPDATRNCSRSSTRRPTRCGTTGNGASRHSRQWAGRRKRSATPNRAAD